MASRKSRRAFQRTHWQRNIPTLKYVRHAEQKVSVRFYKSLWIIGPPRAHFLIRNSSSPVDDGENNCGDGHRSTRKSVCVGAIGWSMIRKERKRKNITRHEVRSKIIVSIAITINKIHVEGGIVGQPRTRA